MTSQHTLVAPCAASGVFVVHFREKEWVLDDDVRYVKCLGGPAGREGILAACRDGQVFKVYVNNAFPCLLWKHRRAIRYADVSVLGSSLALIDDDSCLCVVNVKQGNVRSSPQDVSFALYPFPVCPMTGKSEAHAQCFP